MSRWIPAPGRVYRNLPALSRQPLLRRITPENDNSPLKSASWSRPAAQCVSESSSCGGGSGGGGIVRAKQKRRERTDRKTKDGNEHGKTEGTG